MKSFSEFITEEEQKPVRLRLMPAIRHESGKIHTGKRGDDHAEIREKYTDENGPLKGEAGFYDPKERTFMTRDEAAKHAPRAGASGESTEFLTQAEKEARKARQDGGDSTDRMTDAQRMRKYGTFEEEALQEGGNKLVKVKKALERDPVNTNYMGTVSGDLSLNTSKQNVVNRGKVMDRIKRLVKQKKLRMIGGPKQDGQYRYDDAKEGGDTGVSSEKSFTVAPGEHPKARSEFHGHLTRLGKMTGQESVLKIRKKGQDRATGSLVYTRPERERKVDSAGKMYYNTDMTVGSGQTKMRGKGSSFVITKDTPKGFEGK